MVSDPLLFAAPIAVPATAAQADIVILHPKKPQHRSVGP